MQAAFVDIGENKNVFLHIKDIVPKKIMKQEIKMKVLKALI